MCLFCGVAACGGLVSGSATACPRSQSFDKEVLHLKLDLVLFFIGIFGFFKGQGVFVQMEAFPWGLTALFSVLLQAGDSTTSALKCFKVLCIPHTTISPDSWWKIGSLIMKWLFWGFFLLLMMALKAPTMLLGQLPGHRSQCHLFFILW